jgi:hypothetical protein
VRVQWLDRDPSLPTTSTGVDTENIAVRQLFFTRSPDPRLRSFKRKAFIVIGFELLILMTLMVVYCAMLPEHSDFLYSILAAAICVWLGIVLFLAFRYPTKVWPVALIATTAIILAAAAGIYCSDNRLVQFLFVVAVGIVATSCAIEIARFDFPAAQ